VFPPPPPPPLPLPHLPSLQFLGEESFFISCARPPATSVGPRRSRGAAASGPRSERDALLLGYRDVNIKRVRRILMAPIDSSRVK